MRRAEVGRRLGVAAGALACLLAGSPAGSRGLTPDDLLTRAGFGQVVVAPGGQWLVVEQRAPYASAARFDYDRYTDILRTTLQVADLTQPGPIKPLFPPEAGVGYMAGPISPDGRRMAVYRLKSGRWEVGVATFGADQVHWLGLTPEIADRGRTAQWTDPDRLILIALPPGGTPFQLRALRPQIRAVQRHMAQASGQATVTVLGSGPYLGVGRRDAPKALLAIDVHTWRITRLAEGAFQDLEASPSGRWAAVLETGEDIPVPANGPVQGDNGTEVRRARLALVQVSSGAILRPCPGRDILSQLLAWSPIADRLLVFGRRDGERWPAGELLEVTPRGGVRQLGGEGVTALVANRPATVRAGWLAGDPVVYARHSDDPTSRPGWYRLGASGAVALTNNLPGPAPRDGLAVDGDTLLAAADGRAWRIDPQGETQPATPSGFTLRDPSALRPASRFERGTGARHALVGRLQSGSQDSLVSISGRDVSRLATAADDAVVEAVDPKTRGVVIRSHPGGLAERLMWIDAGRRVTLAAINTALRGVEPPRVRAVPHRGERGELLTSWLVLPPRASGQPPPLIVIPYPGSVFPSAPAFRDLPRGTDLERAAVLAGHGYAVLIPSLPIYPDNAGPGVGLAVRVLAIIDAAGRAPQTRGAFDPERLGLWGFSFGGYATLAILTQTDRFKAAIAKSPISDLYSKHGDTPLLGLVWPEGGLTAAWSAGWTEDLQGDMRGPPWARPERYAANSPALHADRITTPLMIVHGDLDTIPIGQSEEMFTSLFRQAKPALFVAYLGEGHLLASPGNIRDYYARSLAWLDDHLGFAAEPPVSGGQPDDRGRGSANDGPRTR